MKLSTTFSRLMIFFGFSSDLVSASSFEQGLALALEVEVDQHLLDRLGADAGGEGVLAIFVLRVEQLVLGEELVLLERGQARLDDDVGFEIEHALELLELHVEQQADARSAATSGTRCARPARPARYGPCARGGPSRR